MDRGADGQGIGLDQRERKDLSKQPAATYGIPIGTLYRHKVTGLVSKKLGRFTCTFPSEFEKELVNHAKLLDERFYGLTRESLGKLAYLLAEANHIKHPFKNETAGRDWVFKFLERHPELRFRKPEPTSIARAAGFNRQAVDRYFDNLLSVYRALGFHLSASDVYNMDETGVHTTSNNPPKVLSVKGRKQVGVIASAERGQLTTIIGCVNAAGVYIPPCFIFGRRKNVTETLKIGAPEGSEFWCSDSGWINSDLFLKWMKFFILKSHASPESPVLLVLDNHGSHVNLDAVDLAKKSGVHMVTVPPHTTHKLQVLDVAVYKPFKNNFELAIDDFMKNPKNVGVRIAQKHVAGFVNIAYSGLTAQMAKNGFKKCGLYPLNRNIFKDEDFAPSKTFHIPEQENNEAKVLDSNETSTNTNSIGAEGAKDSDLPNVTPNLPVSTAPSSIDDDETLIRNAEAIVLDVCELLGDDFSGPLNLDLDVMTADPVTLATEALRSFDIEIPPLSDTKDDGLLETTDVPVSSAVSEAPKSNFSNENPELSTPSSSKAPPPQTPKLLVSPADILPLPKKTENSVKRRRSNAQRSEILTSSPFKKILLEKIAEKAAPKKKVRRNLSKSMPPSEECAPKETVKKDLVVSAPVSRGKGGRKKNNQLMKENQPPQENNDTENEETFCIFCSEKYVEPPTEDWIQCEVCKKWCHEKCADPTAQQYVCDICANK
nr:PREDICTED: uncharacterized protein LOC109036800 [Bemisia tabaci]